MPQTLHRVQTTSKDSKAALVELITPEFRAAALNFVFVTSPFELKRFGNELQSATQGITVGCTTAGHIGPTGFELRGAAALSFPPKTTRAWTWSIDDVTAPSASIETIQRDVCELLKAHDIDSMFGVLLIDGLCGAEEKLTAELFRALPAIPIVGGSAGDNLNFEETRVLHNGAFRSKIATFTLVSTEIPFSIISMQHHQPTPTRLVVTKADAATRRVYEFNGMPAAEAYAEAIGVELSDLNFTKFSQHPLMVRVGQKYYIRSPRQVENHGAMSFFCAIEEGVVLRIGVTVGAIETLRSEVVQAHTRVKGTQAMLIFDGALRRFELEEQGLDAEAGAILAAGKALGFNTYGEQLDALHINQTLVGVVFGDLNA